MHLGYIVLDKISQNRIDDNMSEGEKVDRFSQGLNPNIKLEVMKAGAQTMNDASRIALNVDSALFGAGMFRFQNNGGFPGSQ